jgi:hypothetical protein
MNSQRRFQELMSGGPIDYSYAPLLEQDEFVHLADGHKRAIVPYNNSVYDRNLFRLFNFYRVILYNKYR